MKSEQELIEIERTLKNLVLDGFKELKLDEKEQAIVLGALTAHFFGALSHVTSKDYIEKVLELASAVKQCHDAEDDIKE